VDITDPDEIAAAAEPYRDRLESLGALLPGLVGATPETIRRLLQANKIRMSDADIGRLAAGGRRLCDEVQFD
jgi:hypothetical protein